MQSNDEEDFEGMEDYDTGREAPSEWDDVNLDIMHPEVDDEWDDDQHPDNGEDDD